MAAAEIKAQYPIAYAAAFAVAKAQRKNARIITGDPDFRKVQTSSTSISSPENTL
jgi:predicted nucleic acid-binding protein